MVQSSVAQLANLANAPKEFGALQVRERVITARGLAISIDNVSTVASLEDTNAWWVLLAVLTLLFAIGGVMNPLALLLALGTGAMAFTAWRRRNSYRLVIATNDGSKFHFIGKDLKIIDEVREFITRKIDQNDPRLTLVANFEKGVIENVHVDQLNAGAVVSGSHNQVAANSPGARVVGQESHTTTNTTTHNQATNSPGAQVGTGNISRGATTVATTQIIDYSSVLPEIERWRQSAAGSQGWEHVAERLATLEGLLAAGTPTREQKTSARSIATDLSQILQGYPAAVQLFQSVIRMIGL